MQYVVGRRGFNEEEQEEEDEDDFELRDESDDVEEGWDGEAVLEVGGEVGEEAQSQNPRPIKTFLPRQITETRGMVVRWIFHELAEDHQAKAHLFIVPELHRVQRKIYPTAYGINQCPYAIEVGELTGDSQMTKQRITDNHHIENPLLSFDHLNLLYGPHRIGARVKNQGQS
ncbi:uncharacterized protein EV420DRAFT_1479440 [Desarmillaria tabescens]|uniref:Uncharacterized protein n=1 Tax=Armillaria tabescens TaxID=1929756 RepID=A0AA39N608_ARMTA|nr:uncharacterized protein EV420DRAFT_1479440 [Desarmillaria tabescens]KAK0458748.1 hypothetical protein EV420DRAFT_1479440 [Desarmillaria tabescens]